MAKLAGVSQSAVSRCFRPDASISDEMRNRVLAAARRLGYAPDAIARSLTTRRSNLIGVIISNLTNLYYPEVLSELNARCAERNVHLLLFTIHNESDVDRVLASVWQYRLDGVIAAARLHLEQVREFERRNVALVLYNRTMSERDVSAVYCDQAGSARIIIDGLVAAGCRRFGLVDGPKDSVVGAERVSACLERLRHHGVKTFARVEGDYTYAGGRAAFAAIKSRLGRNPDAVVAANDVMALGCLDAARHVHGLKVPRDVSVVGFDGVEPGTWMSYGLVTVRQPVQEMAAAAVSLLLDNVENPGRQAERRVFTGTLVPGA
ncbi:MAG TPA: LacI family DNA-binding transcriptional regulator, partial [Steroidobacteraceae bacterium]|nr:LacI family DNA-binding transcriptional regulator [Steroidobacteraceae bacterium]